MKTIRLIIIVIIISAIVSATTSYIIINNKDTDKLIEEFYLIENAVHISPHSLRGKMDKGINDYILVDLRSKEEYEKEHIISAINIPAYKNKDTSDYGAVDRIVGEFKKLPKDKEVIVYCYSTPCMTGRKIGKILAENKIYVKHLGIGWNEWKYSWNSWNHEHEWNKTNADNYLWKGSEPGNPKSGSGSSCPVSGGLGC